MPDHPTSTNDNVVHIRTGRPFQPALRAVEPPVELEKFTHNDEPDDFRHRMLVNVIAFVFVSALIVAALWLANSIATMRKAQDSVLSGKRGCPPVEAPVKIR